jgi:hypothetical protein
VAFTIVSIGNDSRYFLQRSSLIYVYAGFDSIHVDRSSLFLFTSYSLPVAFFSI